MDKINEIKLSNLSIGYIAKSPVVKQINESISFNNLIALVGNNGVGKTTLFRTLIREIKPLSGTIFINNNEINQLSFEEMATQIAVVFTGRQATMGLDVRTVIEMGRHPFRGYFGKRSVKDGEQIKKMISLMKVDLLLNKTMEEISDGEYQKVMITRALVQDTPIILLDEPLAFLDYLSKVSLLKTLKYLVEKTGKLIVFSSHELNLLSPVVDGILSVKEGRMQLITEEVPKYLEKNFIKV